MERAYTFPAAGAAIGLSATGPTIAAGLALTGGATGGCIIAPVIHEKTSSALIQQIQKLKIEEEDEADQTSELTISGSN